MPKQNNPATEEDYLDNLLNSVLNESDADGDFFDREFENISGSDKEFFDSIEKDWMEEKEKEDREMHGPENLAKEMFEKYKEPETGEYRDVPPELLSHEKQQQEERFVQEPEEPGQDAKSEESENIGEEMKGLYDILGVAPEEEVGEKDEEIKNLENEKSKKGKKKKRRGLFGKKKAEETTEEKQVGVALDLMENGSVQESVSEGTQTTEDEAQASEGEDISQPSENPGEETASINSLISDLGLGDGLEEEEEEIPNKKKKEKDKKKKEKKEKKPKKPKKAKKKKAKKPKKPKKEKAPKEPDEIIRFSLPGLMFFLSIGVLAVFVTFFGGDYYNYTTRMSEATSCYLDQKYGEAYDELYTLTIKKNDEYFYGQVTTIMQVYTNYRSYQTLIDMGNYEDALDSLLNGVRMFDKYKDVAREEYNCYDDLNNVLGWIVQALQDSYGINESQAREINFLGKGKEYAYRVAELSNEALRKEIEANAGNS